MDTHLQYLEVFIWFTIAGVLMIYMARLDVGKDKRNDR